MKYENIDKVLSIVNEIDKLNKQLAGILSSNKISTIQIEKHNCVSVLIDNSIGLDGTFFDTEFKTLVSKQIHNKLTALKSELEGL